MAAAPLNIAVACGGAAGLRLLGDLLASRHRLCAVFAQRPGEQTTLSSVWQFATQNDLPLHDASLLRLPESADLLRRDSADLLLSFRSPVIVCPEALAAPAFGAFNLHTGPLPRYAGMNAVCWAIYHGETQHGVTLHEMVPKIDAGRIVYQAMFDIAEDDTGLSVTNRCIREGQRLFRDLVNQVATDPAAMPRIEQDLSQRSYFGRGVPQDGKLIWDRTARAIVDFVRACDFHPLRSPWGHPRAILRGSVLHIARARRTDAATDGASGVVTRLEGDDAVVNAADEQIRLAQIIVGEDWVAPSSVLRVGDRLEDGD